MKQQHTTFHLSISGNLQVMDLCGIPPNLPILPLAPTPRSHQGPTGLALFVADLPGHLPLQHEELLDELQALELRLQRRGEESITSAAQPGNSFCQICWAKKKWKRFTELWTLVFAEIYDELR